MNVQLVPLSLHVNGLPAAGTGQLLLRRLPAVLGRGDDADVRILDPWVSRQHCQFTDHLGALFVKDLGSKHGTWINHARVAESLVLPGDELEIGLTAFRAEYELASG
jgi:pSer/pThr/pTyr-binding forkhead associated (FHA) protein